MRSAVLACLPLAAFALHGGEAEAQQEADPAMCEQLQPPRGLPMADPVQLEIPDELAGRALQTGKWLATANEFGGTNCTYLGWVITAEPVEILSDRLIGFAWTGYETWGYKLIDTDNGGVVIETASRPALSPSGRRLAFVEMSDARLEFEGFGVFALRDRSIAPLHIDTFIPAHFDWRIDGWEGEDCVFASSVPRARVEDYDRIDRYERDHFVAGRQGGWRLTPGSECPTYP